MFLDVKKISKENYAEFLWFVCRYIAVCKPLKVLYLSTSRGVKIQLFVVVLISNIIEIPRFLETRIETYTHNGHTYTVEVSTDLYQSDLYQLLYKTLFLVILRRLIPMLIIVTLTVKLTSAIRNTRKIRSELIAFSKTKHAAKRHADETITSVLIIIALIFIVCQAPGMVYPIFRMTLERDSCCNFFYFYAAIADLLSVLCSGLNFFVYYLLVPAFRNQVKKLVCKWRSKRRIQPQRFASYKVNVITDST